MKPVVVSAGVIIENGKVLVTQRKIDSPQGLLWEFPGGKVEDGEEPRGALRRELGEELGIEVEVGKMLEATFHPYPDLPILLLTYRCRVVNGLPRPLGCRDFRWVDLEALERLDMPPADDPIRKYLRHSKQVF